MIGKVYKITGKGKSYVGSTTQDLKQRLWSHFKTSLDTTGRRNSVLYKFIRENGTDHFTIELIEEYPCETIKELRTREQYWLDELKPELNMFRSIANPKYEQECRDKEERRRRSNRFYHEHKELVLERQRKYNKDHKDEIRERKKKYLEDHKEELKKKKAEKMTCECGCEITKLHLKRHQQTKLHKEFMNKE
jgi:hypothetical protein